MTKITKVSAIKQLISDNGGVASWQFIYEHIGKYYPSFQSQIDWAAGLRGVLYREIKNNCNFKKVGIGLYGLIDYDAEKPLLEIKADKVRMHSYMEGVFVELGNYENYATYCTNPSEQFQNKVAIGQLTTVSKFPTFTYPKIIDMVRWIDVVWFNAKGHQFPIRVNEIVDSIGTLDKALNRMYQLKDFHTIFCVITPKTHFEKVEKALEHEPYSILRDRFIVRTYDEVLEHYKARIALSQTKF